jgi:hypothetical protein
MSLQLGLRGGLLVTPQALIDFQALFKRRLLRMFA